MNRALVLDIALVVAALLVAEAPFPPGFIENTYANGFFAALNASLVPLTNRVRFALGDLEAGLLVAGLVTVWARALRRGAEAPPIRVLRALAHTVGIAAFVVLAFNVLWGLNYRRATVATRVDFDAARVTPAAVSAFSDRIVGILNADVAAAHARAATESEAEMRAELARDWEPVIARLGDRWPVVVTVPKTTIADRFYEAAGVGGQYDPFAFETILNASFLPFEIPRALAHEWSHVGGFGDEGDANLIGTIACLRSSDPLIRYSGAFWTYGELPDADRKRLKLAPAVVADFKASQARFERYYNPRLFDLSWHVYDRYLRANGVSGGVVSYSHDLQMLVGTRFDAAGLPVARSVRATETSSAS